MELLNDITWDAKQRIALLCAAVFLLVGLAFLFVILISRIFKIYHEKRYAALRNSFQRKLNVFVAYGNERSQGKSFLWPYHMQELRIQLGNARRKQFMIDLLISNKQNLSGQSAAILRKIYLRLGLRRFSILKLANANDQIKTKGLHELAEMECSDALPLIQPLLHHKSQLVRMESFIAMVRLAGAAPFALIPHYPDSISGWMQMIIHKHLTTLPTNKLPKFYLWLANANPAVRKFAINMITAFRQLDAIPALASLLNDSDLEMAALAADSLGTLGASEHAESIAQLGTRSIMDESTSLSVVRALAKIGTGKNHQPLLSWHMIHSSYQLRKEAMRALIDLKVNLLDSRLDFDLENDDEFDCIHAHIIDPLLR